MVVPYNAHDSHRFIIAYKAHRLPQCSGGLPTGLLYKTLIYNDSIYRVGGLICGKIPASSKGNFKGWQKSVVDFIVLGRYGSVTNLYTCPASAAVLCCYIDDSAFMSKRTLKGIRKKIARLANGDIDPHQIFAIETKIGI